MPSCSSDVSKQHLATRSKAPLMPRYQPHALPAWDSGRGRRQQLCSGAVGRVRGETAAKLEAGRQLHHQGAVWLLY